MLTAANGGSLVGRMLGQYRVDAPLGTGAMGVVYRAWDTRLHRTVALKLVGDGREGGSSATPDAADDGKALLLAEARAASGLNHPHICTIYDAQEQDGRAFIAMEHVAGQSLSAMAQPDGLPEQTVIRFAIQIADALAHAHARGIVHRDLKSANVVVTPEGHAKVLDFGLARVVRRGDLDDATRSDRSLVGEGRIAGTLPYMAPEVLRGERADERSDLWALGVVMYEMAAGSLPFTGKTGFEVSSAILRGATPQVPAPCSAGLRSVIQTCLAKEPGQRYQRAAEIVAALRTLESGASPQPVQPRSRAPRKALMIAAAVALTVCATAVAMVWRRPSSPPERTGPTTLAVLPLRALGNQTDLGSLGVGIADAIITRMAGVKQMRLRPTNAILRFENQVVDAQEAGRELSSDYVLTGTAQAAGTRLAVSLQLVRVSDGAPIWGDRYDLPRADLLELQDTIARRVADALKIEMTAAEQAQLYRRYTANVAAHEDYLRGRADLARYTAVGTRAAISSFEQAIALDPKYALARAGLAMASAEMHLRFAPAPEVKTWGDRAVQEAERALALDANLAETHQALAAVYRKTEFNWDRTIQESRRALELNPSLDLPHTYLAGAFYHLGLLEQSDVEARKALEINPQNPMESLRTRGIVALFEGRPAEAVAFLQQVPANDTYLAQAYYYQGQRERAEGLLRDLRRSAAGAVAARASATLASFQAARGDRSAAEASIESVVTGSYRDHHVAYSLGAAYAQLGDRVKAQQWLDEASNSGFRCYPWYQRDPLLQPLKGAPEFERLLTTLGEAHRGALKAHGR